MAICQLQSYDHYWSMRNLYPPVADLLSRDTFRQCQRYLHFANNENMIVDRNSLSYLTAGQVLPLLEAFRQLCLQFPAEEKTVLMR